MRTFLFFCVVTLLLLEGKTLPNCLSKNTNKKHKLKIGNAENSLAFSQNWTITLRNLPLR